MRTIIRTVIVIALAVGLVALFLRDADLALVWKSVTAARKDYLLLAVVMVAVGFVIRAERWKYLLEPIGHARFRNALRTTVIGFGASADKSSRERPCLHTFF